MIPVPLFITLQLFYITCLWNFLYYRFSTFDIVFFVSCALMCTFLFWYCFAFLQIFFCWFYLQILFLVCKIRCFSSYNFSFYFCWFWLYLCVVYSFRYYFWILSNAVISLILVLHFKWCLENKWRAVSWLVWTWRLKNIVSFRLMQKW